MGPIGTDKLFFKHKIVTIFLSISLNMCFGLSKELSQRLMETVLLSTHNICFGLE